VLFFLALAIAVGAIAGRFALERSAVGERIARVTVGGTITTDAARLRMFDTIADDDTVKAVIVAINSPGGTTAGGEELYEALGKLRAKKPVVAVISELGASAAYMTAIASDRIFARRLSIVGSIGVLYQHVNAGKLLDTIGVDLDKVQTGPLKAEPDLDEPMLGPVRASLQALVDDSFAWFVDIVAERRGCRARSGNPGRRPHRHRPPGCRSQADRRHRRRGRGDRLARERQALAADLPVITTTRRPTTACSISPGGWVTPRRAPWVLDRPDRSRLTG
jgi:signal peptide peptidase SppA